LSIAGQPRPAIFLRQTDVTAGFVRYLTLWTVVAATGLAALLLSASAVRGRLRHHYRHHFQESRRERLFLSSAAFFLTFGIVRVITHSIHAGRGPFRNIEAGDLHIHHLVWGILLLLVVGYCWLAQVGTGERGASVWAGRITSLLYGIAGALTLDEFALWLRLRDVYWGPEGRASVHVALLFGALLSVGIFGGPFFHAMARDLFGRGGKQRSY
jgi:hypothetical protein